MVLVAVPSQWPVSEPRCSGLVSVTWDGVLPQDRTHNSTACRTPGVPTSCTSKQGVPAAQSPNVISYHGQLFHSTQCPRGTVPTSGSAIQGQSPSSWAATCPVQALYCPLTFSRIQLGMVWVELCPLKTPSVLTLVSVNNELIWKEDLYSP
jgi:hypothetical protein